MSRASWLACLLLIFHSILLSAQTWKGTGPSGATIDGMTVLSSHLLFASTSKAAFRSTNSGKSWQRMNLSGVFIYPFQFRFHPRQLNRLLAFKALDGRLYASSDSGKNWQQVRIEGEVYELAFSSHHPNIVFAFGDSELSIDHSAMFKSTDAGLSWTPRQIALRSGFFSDAKQLIVDPTNPRIFYVLLSVGGSGAIYKSSDGGNHWHQLNTGQYYLDTLTMDPIHPKTLYAGGQRGILKTIDGGAHWFSTNCSCATQSIAIDRKNSNLLFAVGSARSERSVRATVVSYDAGEHWAQLPLNASLKYSIVTLDQFHPGWVWVGSAVSGIYLSRNLGKNFELHNGNLSAFSIELLRRNPAQPAHLFAVTDSGGLFTSRDGGFHWQPKNVPSDFVIQDLRIHPKNSQLIAIAGCCPALEISNDGGTTWTPNEHFNEPASTVRWDPENVNQLFLLIPEGIAGSSDSGKTWRLLGNGLRHEFLTTAAIIPLKNGELLVGSSKGKIFHSANSGDRWELLHDFRINAAHVTQILIPQNNPFTLFAVLLIDQDEIVRALYKSEDGGKSWVAKRTPGISKAFQDPDHLSTVYALSDSRLIKSTDGGDSWSSVRWNLPHGIADFLITPDHLIAGTEMGVFISKR